LPTLSVARGQESQRAGGMEWSGHFRHGVLVFFMARYTTWRINSTINFDSAYLFIYSLMYFFFELIDLIVFFGGRVTSIFSTKIENSKTADALRQGLLGKENFPLVDILVPTCGEPIFTLRRTILCCSILNYPNKKIYILDDSNRPEIKELSFEFQCEYIARKDRKHAKAGNLNNALTQINGEFIAVMDADFAPFKDFLDRSIGFFEDKSIGLVQSSQGFYNSDCYLRGLGVENLFPSDLAYFFDIDLSCRDFWGTAACCGTSYVVRRSALDAIGGYVTKCINEDTPTSVKMEINGFNVVYLNEILSVGESPRTYPDFVGQRCRWHLGDYQICLSTDDILIWHKLSFSQIIYYLCWYLKSFLPISRLFSLIALLVFAAFGISPISSSLNNFIYFWLPWITIYVFSYRWISGQRSSYIFRELYNTLLIFPLLICQIRALIKPG
jgi:cellulose synthase (UDP-forming)